MSENLPIKDASWGNPLQKSDVLLLEVSEVFLEFWRVFVESGNMNWCLEMVKCQLVFLGQDDTTRWLFGACQKCVNNLFSFIKGTL